MQQIIEQFIAPLILLLLAAFVCLYQLEALSILPGNEASHAALTRQMYEQTTFPQPDLQSNEARQRPPLLFLVQGLAFPYAGLNEQTVRLVNSCSALLFCTCFYLLGRVAVGDRFAILSLAILLATPLFSFKARYGFPDPLICVIFYMSISSVWLSFERILHGRSHHTPIFLVGVFTGLLALAGGIGYLILTGVITLCYGLMIPGSRKLLFRTPFLAALLLSLLISYSWYPFLFFSADASMAREVFISHHLMLLEQFQSTRFLVDSQDLILGGIMTFPWIFYLPVSLSKTVRLEKIPAEQRYFQLLFISGLAIITCRLLLPLPSLLFLLLPLLATLLATPFYHTSPLNVPTRLAGLGVAVIIIGGGIMGLFLKPTLAYLQEIYRHYTTWSVITPNLSQLATPSILAISVTMLLIGIYFLWFQKGRSILMELFSHLCLISILLSLLIHVFLLPLGDRLYGRPVKQMAALILPHVPENTPILLYKMSLPPPLGFYHDGPFVTTANLDLEQLVPFMIDKHIGYGLTTSNRFSLLSSSGLPLKSLTDSPSLVLFQLEKH